MKHPGLGNLEPHGYDITKWHMVTDEGGRPIGSIKAPFMPVREQMEIVRQFLIRISKRKEEPMAEREENPKVNMVWLAGKLKGDPKIFDNNVKALIDVGMRSAVQISIYTGAEGNEELAAKLKRFRQGDYIKAVCMLRPYGKKDNEGEWHNGMSVDVTHIKNEPPRKESSSRPRGDDDIPF